MTAPPLTEPLLTPRDAAGLLGLSVKTVYRLAALARLPAYSVTRGERKQTLRFVRSELSAWLASRRVLPPGVGAAAPLPRPVRARGARRA
jgi:excisionase family DNA binding protein